MGRRSVTWLMISSVGYLASASLGAALAIAAQLPAGFLGLLHGHNVPRDVLTIGTALSPPLVMPLIQVALTICAPRTDRAGLVGIVGLTILGACYTLGQLGEPIVVRALAPATFNPAQAVLVTTNLILSVLMIVFGARAWRARVATGRGR